MLYLISSYFTLEWAEGYLLFAAAPFFQVSLENFEVHSQKCKTNSEYHLQTTFIDIYKC